MCVLSITVPIGKSLETYLMILVYIYMYFSGKQDDSLERQSDSSENWSDILERQEFNKYG